MEKRTSHLPLQIRIVPQSSDCQTIRELVAATGFFRPDEVDVAVELVEEWLRRGEASGYHFTFAEQDGCVVGYTCYGPIACTLGSYDLYWIAVHPDRFRQGIGRRLMADAESRIRDAGGARIYIDTSNLPQYASTRQFYSSCGYKIAAILDEFYGPQDDKVIFEKRL